MEAKSKYILPKCVNQKVQSKSLLLDSSVNASEDFSKHFLDIQCDQAFYFGVCQESWQSKLYVGMDGIWSEIIAADVGMKTL